MDEAIVLVEPTLELADEFAALADEYRRSGSDGERRHFANAIKDLPAYVRKCQLQGQGGDQTSPAGVPCNTYWLVAGGTIVATSHLYHRLTPLLLHEGGHIGYGTRPTRRQMGFGRTICAMTLQQARALHLKRVLITCDSDNIASARIILANGGVLENQVVSRTTGKIKNRYWVDLSA